MLNLVQISEKLKDMPMQAVAAYANGSNPMVPPYVALGELNRRKQMEQSAAAEQSKQAADQPTVKDQMEQQLGLMSIQQQRQAQGAQQMGQAMANNPGIPAQAPVQMARGGIVPSKLFKQEMRPRGEVSRGVPEERGISGNDLKKMMMMAAMKKQRDGIANLPMKREMLSKKNFAGGGIVAFQQGGETDREMRDFDQAAALYEAEREAAKAKEATPIDTSDLIKSLVQKAGKEQTLEGIFAGQKRAKELAGVSDDPYAESRKSREELIAERRAYDKDQPRRRLQETLLGIAGAKPGQGLGVALGEGARADLKEQERFRALNDQQKTQELQWQRADEKEKDAIARGDAKGALEAQQQKDELNFKIGKLAHEKENFLYLKAQTALNTNPDIKRLNDELESKTKLGLIKPGTPQYQWYVDQIQGIRDAIYSELGITNARVKPPAAPPFPQKEKPGEAKKATPATTATAPQKITNDAAGEEKYNKLESGDKYIDPTGKLRTKP